MSDWIKVQTTLPNKREVVAVASMLGIDRYAVVGRLIELWSWFDANTVDGFCHAVSVTYVDDLCRQNGFADALLAVGWLQVSEDPKGVLMPHFERHNGKSSKNRALNAERQSRHRVNGNADTVTNVTQEPLLNALPDKRREEHIDQDQKKDQKHVPQAARFEEFWSAYPIKRGKSTARAKWVQKRLDGKADDLIADVQKRITDDEQWLRGFAPHASTYLHQERWQDELKGREQPKATQSKTMQALTKLQEMKHGQPNVDTEPNAAPRHSRLGGPASV
jgi:hypothetical protein